MNINRSIKVGENHFRSKQNTYLLIGVQVILSVYSQQSPIYLINVSEFAEVGIYSKIDYMDYINDVKVIFTVSLQ